MNNANKWHGAACYIQGSGPEPASDTDAMSPVVS